jgi:Zinc finger, C3HC4 type (RING finger)
MNVQIRLENGEWVPANAQQIEAFRCFTTGDYEPKEERILRYVSTTNDANRRRIIRLLQEETPYSFETEQGTFTIKRHHDEHHGPILLTNEQGARIPIGDWNSVQVFLQDHPSLVTEWYDARTYQIWAYFHFIHSGLERCSYKTKNSSGYSDAVEIPIEGLPRNIIFSLGRENNGATYYERNDESRTQTRISDSNKAKAGYMGFYNRVWVGNDDLLNPIVETGPPTQSWLSSLFNNSAASSTRLTPIPLPPSLIVRKATCEEDKCAVCYENSRNIQFHGCKHTYTCSECYTRLPNPRECPICRQNIVFITRFNYLEK